jgi:glucose-1-phosphate adenylyltransferase
MIIGFDPIEDRKRFDMSANGVVLVTPDMLGQDLHHAR